MSGILHLAWRYISYHRMKSAIMISCITLTLFLPIALSILLAKFNAQIVDRSESTPLVIGAKGSRIDLTLHSLYFKTRTTSTIPFGQADEVHRDDLGTVIPILSVATSKKIPVVGTSLDYFDFRNIQLGEGDGLVRLGDCVLGSEVAKQIDVEPGEYLLTDAENILDLAGAYPLNMRVRGILEPTRTADDHVIFVDLKTAWVIEGLGHGHDDVDAEHNDDKILGREGGTTIASAAITPYTEITDQNVHSFHFHGEEAEFPVSAIIALPKDDKSRVILLGRFQSDDAAAQISEPPVVVRELMGLIFQVKKFFDANAILIAASTVLLMVLVIMLSIRLRKSEMETMFKLGCRRGTIASLVGAELLIICLIAGLILAGLVTLTLWNADELVRNLLVS